MSPTLVAVALVVVGFITLLTGGEVLVRGAAGLATAMRISPLVIGLTVVAFGTSAPELAVVLQSSALGQQDVAIGNVVGSCIFNILFILGLTAVVAPLAISASLVRIELPLMIVSSVAVMVLGWDAVLGRLDGAILFGALIAYMVWTVVQARRERREFQEAVANQVRLPRIKWLRAVGMELALVLIGLVLLSLGSRWTVVGAVDIARMLGVSELLIGLTIVAIGTSLPEVVTSVVAGIRGRSDIAVGNLVGSNIFNLLCVLGLGGLLVRHGIAVSPEALHLDIPVMIGVAVACLPIFWTRYRVDRWEGSVLFACYLAYTAYIILAASHPAVSRTFGFVMVALVLPLLAIILIIRSLRAMGQRRASAPCCKSEQHQPGEQPGEVPPCQSPTPRAEKQ